MFKQKLHTTKNKHGRLPNKIGSFCRVSLFAFVPLFAYQGTISLFASRIKPLIEGNPEMMNQFSMVGYAIIMCIGINFIAGQKIKTANLLPAMLVPILYNMLKLVENLW